VRPSDLLPPTVEQIIAAVPGYYTGTDRLKGFAANLEALPEQERARLRDVFESFVTRMIDLGASDLDAGGPAANGQVWYRVGGDKKPRPEVGTFTVDQSDVLFLNVLNDKQRRVLWDDNSIDFSYELDFLGTDGRGRRFRATCYFDYDHLGLNMRSITDEVRPIKSLEFHPLIEKGLMFRHERDGLTLVTGVTGSGKSSTLDAIIDANNEDSHAHIIVVGKPIEYMHRSKKCIVRHREVGKDVPTFKDGIVQALRQDPDIVVIGEMRDPETISAGLEITDSGHKVFSTLHTSSAVESIDRIIGEYPHEEQERVRNRLADVLRCVVSQKLAPRIGGGRVLCKEVLWMTSPARAAIKNKNAGEIYQMMWEGNAQGMITMEQDLFRLVRQRLITPETAFSYANNKKRLQQLLG
jgi:twitching motility protein PilT